ncbi:MAG: single-stranded DNA-binding protein [Actinomycetota bacterium]|nr:single-stranded DNA-binding protein [Actinomycetota bacterium]
MAKDLNRVMMIGRLGQDPEMRYTPQGTAVCQMRLAVNRRTRAGADGEQREETDWFTVVAWERLAETCSQYLTRGSRVYFEGRLQTRSWEGQDGQRRYATEIVANDMIMLDSRQPAGVASGRGGDDLEEITMDGGDIPF